MYHYTECGLDGVWLVNGYEIEDTPYGETVSIRAVKELHNFIGLTIINECPELTGKQIRFLRKELNLSQLNLAGLLGVGETSIRAWESERAKMGTPTERLLRGLYREHVQGDGSLRRLIDRLCHQDRVYNTNAHAQRRSINLSYTSNNVWSESVCGGEACAL